MKNLAENVFLLQIGLLYFVKAFGATNCTQKADCSGYRSDCLNNSCSCPSGYNWHQNGKDCQQSGCNITDCLECESSTLCSVCVHYLAEGRRRCLSQCDSHTVYDEQDRGPICIPGEDDIVAGLGTDVVIGIIAGVSGALVLCIIIMVVLCIYYRKTRRKVNLHQTHYVNGNMQTGNVKKVPMYDNIGFDTENEPPLVHNVIDRDVYLREMDRLKPHAQTLLTMLNDIRRKLRDMDKTDPRIPTYKGVVHQLCRVLVLIHKKDPGVSIPSDALGLMEWAHQMIEDKLMDVEPAEESIETNPVNRISYVEVPQTAQNNPYAIPVIKKPNPYATLNKRNSKLIVSNISDTSYYSSVPVPVNMHSSSASHHVSVSENNTMRRTSKENLKRQYEIPWDLKKVSDSFSTLNCSGSDLTMGYFANGRYYDPSPRQMSFKQPPVKQAKQSDIYAPASSYSDQSNPPVFSTFTGGIPRNLSISTQASTQASVTSEHNGQAEEEVCVDDTVQDGDGFPFNLNEATEPVEV